MPNVTEAIAHVYDDPAGNKALVGYLVMSGKADARPPVKELARALGENLPTYMVPTAFFFLDAIPRLPNGKIDRKALPTPTAESRTADRPRVLPKTATEELLARLSAAC